MSFLRGRRTFSSWIALLTILVVTLAPSVTGMLSTSSGQRWDQVCSATSLTVAEGATSGDESPAAPHAFAHCPYCALHADLAPPPDPRQASEGIALAVRAQPAAFVHAPRANAVWTSAQPRAPPSVA